MNKKVTDYLQEIGARGGAAGKGEAKRRSAKHYKLLVARRAFLKKIQSMPADQVCAKYHFQNCHCCERFDCCDNTNPKKGNQ